MEHILKLEQVKKYYGGAAGNITKAVDGISMEVNKMMIWNLRQYLQEEILQA